MAEPYVEQAGIQAIADKADELARRLVATAPHCNMEQRHLDDGSLEQEYWHYGYLCAIKDILAIVQSDGTSDYRGVQNRTCHPLEMPGDCWLTS